MAKVFLAHNFQYNRNSKQNSYPKFYIRKLENNTVSFSLDIIFFNCVFCTPQQIGIAQNN